MHISLYIRFEVYIYICIRVARTFKSISTVSVYFTLHIRTVDTGIIYMYILYRSV